jgi:hypothetical protein
MSDYFVEAPTQVAVAETIEHVEVQEDPHSIITEPAGRSVYIVDFLHIQVYS